MAILFKKSILLSLPSKYTGGVWGKWNQTFLFLVFLCPLLFHNKATYKPSSSNALQRYGYKNVLQEIQETTWAKNHRVTEEVCCGAHSFWKTVLQAVEHVLYLLLGEGASTEDVVLLITPAQMRSGEKHLLNLSLIFSLHYYQISICWKFRIMTDKANKVLMSIFVLRKIRKYYRDCLRLISYRILFLYLMLVEHE